VTATLDTEPGEACRVRFAALSTTASVVLTDPRGLAIAERLLRTQLGELDRVASRFRADSELNVLLDRPGQIAEIGPLLTHLLAAALRAAELTDGLVDPTVGQAVVDAGYDRDFALLAGRTAPEVAPRPAPGWAHVVLDEHAGTVLVPRGMRLDLGATAKAVAADRAADTIAGELGCGVLVELGGDIAVRGPAPEGGWVVQIGDDARAAAEANESRIAIRDGGVATSSTIARTWRRGGGTAHHVVDPRTGEVATATWRTVTVAGGTCVDANTASTAAIVLGVAAPAWLGDLGLPARLVGAEGRQLRVAGWPCGGPRRLPGTERSR
jgi:thiamine biosynthesis lipoprotein